MFRLGLTSFLILVPFFLGCGDGYPKRYPIKGQLKFADGSPVKTGTIEIGGNKTRWTASGEIQRDGSFVLTTINKGDGAVPGEYKIVIRQLVLAYLPAEGGHDHGKLVHTKYRDYASTDLKVSIFPRSNNDLNLVVEEAK